MQRWICRHRENKQRSLVFSCLCNRNTIVHLHSVYNDTPVFVTVIVTLSQLCADIQFFVKRPRVSLSPVSDILCRHLRTFCYSTDKTRRRDQSSGKTSRSDKTYRRDETCWSDETCRRDETCWSDKMCRRDKSVSQHIRCLERYMISTTFLSYCLGIFAVIPLSSFSVSLYVFFIFLLLLFYF